MLVAYTVAIDLVRQLRPIVEQIKMHDAHLAEQLKRAATIPSRISPKASAAPPATSGVRTRTRTARRARCSGCLDCALAWGYAPDDGVARATLDRLLALCWGLTH
jgi:hypothetical protein